MVAKSNEKLKQLNAQVKAVVAPALLRHGFVDHGARTFARPSPMGIGRWHVIEFQVGQKEGFYRLFTVNLGIYSERHALAHG